MIKIGYDIIASKTKKEWNKSGSLYHVQCQYAYQSVFKKVLGYDIKELDGVIYKKDTSKVSSALNNLINGLEASEEKIDMLVGNLANCTKDQLINDFMELKKLIDNGQVGYLSIT